MGAYADESPANYVAYLYGSCEQPKDGDGCSGSLQIQTWPACQRTLVDYSFEGELLPYQELPAINGAKVVEIDFLVDRRIEIYTGSSTVIIWATNPDLAAKALQALGSQEQGEPLATTATDLPGQPEDLEPPVDGAMEGDLRCET